MKVALIQDWLNGMRGGEKVLETWCEIFPEAPVYTLFYEPDRVSDTIRRHKVIPSVLQNLPFTKRCYRYYLPLFPWAAGRFDLSGYDLVISTSHCAAKGVRVPEGAVHVCYCLTPMRYIWDKFEEYFGKRPPLSPSRMAMTLLRPRLQRWDVATAERVDFFIASSHFIAERIKRYYGGESSIVSPPVDTNFYRPGSGNKPGRGTKELSGDYFLVVSALVPYKRVDIAVEAFRERPEKLLVVGSGPEEKHLRSKAPENVKFLGWISDVDLLELYRECRALIFPPEEDFGIVPLEAMACGRPVIAFAGGGALETVVEGKTGLFFREQTAASLARALDAFRSDRFDPDELTRHARKFSREACLNNLKTFLMEKVGLKC